MKLCTALLAVVLAFGLCHVAATDGPSAGVTNARSPDRVAPAGAPLQDLRSPDQVAPGGASPQDLRAPDQAAPAASPLALPVAATDPLTTSDGSLGIFWIVLIGLGGAATLAAASYATMRIAHAHGRPAG
jgi:hypothetical protein